MSALDDTHGGDRNPPFSMRLWSRALQGAPADPQEPRTAKPDLPESPAARARVPLPTGSADGNGRGLVAQHRSFRLELQEIPPKRIFETALEKVCGAPRTKPGVLCARSPLC